jgi:MYXO-CTERM domain-containing protein
MKARKVSQHLIALGIAGALCGTTNDRTTQATQNTQSDDESNWGWIGLIGLAGLLGLRKRPDVHRDDARGRFAS